MLPAMIVATFNINGIKARIDSLIPWLKSASPDVCCLQEIKSEDNAFPRQPFEDIGYNLLVHGQKGFNGVAILSKRPPEDASPRLAGDDGDEHSRYLEALIPGKSGVMRVASIYLPNGNPPHTDKYAYKLRWMDRLAARAKQLLALEEPLVLAGDFNVIPAPEDARNPAMWVSDALFLPETRSKFRALLNLGLIDAVRASTRDAGVYTFWDYQAGSWQKNNGIRIDHCLISPQAADRLQWVRIDKHVRATERPSDHVPVLASFDI
jgi:exodeoxyribonuclease-3